MVRYFIWIRLDHPDEILFYDSRVVTRQYITTLESSLLAYYNAIISITKFLTVKMKCIDQKLNLNIIVLHNSSKVDLIWTFMLLLLTCNSLNKVEIPIQYYRRKKFLIFFLLSPSAIGTFFNPDCKYDIRKLSSCHSCSSECLISIPVALSFTTIYTNTSRYVIDWMCFTTILKKVESLERRLES